MELLKDPLKDRQINSVPLPPQMPLKSSLLFPSSLKGQPDFDLLLNFLKAEGTLAKKDAVTIVKSTMNLLKKEPNLKNMNDPICIFGDIHGHFYDLLNMY